MENNIPHILKNNLVLLRRHARLTQEQFAEKLDLSFQAVSKWENGLSCPDISLLPEIARIFGIRIDQLFTPLDAEKLAQPETPMPDPALSQMSKQAAEQAQKYSGHSDGSCSADSPAIPDLPPKIDTVPGVPMVRLPWGDDDVYRAVLFRGKTLVSSPSADGKTLTIGELDDDLLSAFSVTCDTIGGDVRCVLGTLTCDTIGGDVINCSDIQAETIGGDVRQCGTVTCEEVNGDAVQCGAINCDEING